MNHAGNEVDARLLVILQQGLPITARPFASIGEGLGLSEATVLERVRALFESGVARRFGAVFESGKLGYLSTLCAVDIPAGELEAATARISSHPGITHCYEREGHPNLWFTMTALKDELGLELARVSAALGTYEVLNLPALQKFKIEAVFGREKQNPRRTHPLPLQGGEQEGSKTIDSDPLQGGEQERSKTINSDPLLGGVGVGSS
ncbi:MAG: AsnC family transcriptional regulator, partial [bacterium]